MATQMIKNLITLFNQTCRNVLIKFSFFIYPFIIKMFFSFKYVFAYSQTNSNKSLSAP